MAKKVSLQLAEEILNAGLDITDKKIAKAQYDKSFNATILGVNQDFTDDVLEKDQETLIKKYSIPEVPDKDNYYTFKINGSYYVKSSNTSFNLYEKVVIRVPNGNWDNMYIVANKSARSGSGVSTQLIASVDEPSSTDYKLKDGDYWIKIDNEDDRNAEAAYQWNEKEKIWNENASFVIRNYTAGKGIEISDEDEISTKIDNLTMAYNDNGEMMAIGITVSEEAAPYLLNQYTEVGYINDNPVGYGGAQNPIVVQGYVVYPMGETVKMTDIYGNTSKQYIPRIEEQDTRTTAVPYGIVKYGSSISLTGAKYHNTDSDEVYDVVSVNLEVLSLTVIGDNYYNIYAIDKDGNKIILAENLFTSINERSSEINKDSLQLFLLYEDIFSPSSKVLGETYQYGYAVVYLCMQCFERVDRTYYTRFTESLVVPFNNLAEYNAAISLKHKTGI